MKTYDFRSFIAGEKMEIKKTQAPLWSFVPFVPGPIYPVHAATQESLQAKMMAAFEPLIELIQGLAYPVALAVVLGGSIMVMIGNTEKGFSMMSKAAMGYVLCMLLPTIFGVLVDAMAGVL